MSDVMVEGELNSDKNLVVDGQFKGTIAAANNTVAMARMHWSYRYQC